MDDNMLLSGREFCDMYDIDFEKINADRMANGQKNRKYFWNEIQSIIKKDDTLAMEFTVGMLQETKGSREAVADFLDVNEDWAKSMFELHLVLALE